DAQKGALFTKVSREIYMAARKGGPEPESNFLLKVAITRARAVNMPADNIKRVIEKATGGAEGENFEEVTYEGYGPAGVAILVEAATDNRNRTAAEVRSTFSKHGGNLGETGCVAWLFERRGLLNFTWSDLDEEALLMAALEAGALDMKAADEGFEVFTDPSDLHAVKDALEAVGFPSDEVEITQLPKTSVDLSREDAPTVLRLMEALEDLDDVQDVYANFDIPADLLEELQAESS
ncbi:MAG: YebC/PmpR family DNA-binding transcriptional regulator, partial [Burkholderiales bacterium]|nr:YebC/PmpR family DNA-binding transcriptional regulator [Burkholderiales bacterium]